MTVLALLVACRPDPTLHKDFRAPTLDPPAKIEVRVPRAYRIGEVMDVQIAIEAPIGARLQGGIGGPGGRPDYDLWTVRPENTVDPSPFWEDFAGFIVTRRSGLKRGESTTLTVPLDQEVAFTEPGTYGVQLETTRVDTTETILAPFALEVLPRDPAADQVAFEAALKGLEAERPVDREPHFRTLRALGTPAVLDRALDELQEEEVARWWTVLVHSHPDRDRAEAELVRRLEAPDQVVTPELFETLVAVRYNRATSTASPAEPPPTRVPQLKAYNKEMKARKQRRLESEEQVAAELAAVVDTKTVGRGSALEALSRVGYRVEDAAWRDAWLAALRNGLHETTELFQTDALTNRWSFVRDSAVVDALATIAGRRSAVGGLALRRLASLAPDRAQAVALARLKTPEVVASDDGERVLADLDTVPSDALDGLVAALVGKAGDARLARLVARHGGPAHADRVAEAWKSLPADRTPSDVRAGYAAYFLNTGTHPELADALLADRMAKTPDLLIPLADAVRDPAPIVRMAMKDLVDDSRPLLQLAAGEVVAEHGEPRVVPLLELALQEAPGSRQVAVATALFTARNWVGSKAQRARVMRQLNEERAGYIVETTSIATEDMTNLLGWVDDGVPTLQVNGRDYVGAGAIVAKLKQFPPGAPVKIAYRGAAEVAEPVLQPLTHDAGLALWVPRKLEELRAREKEETVEP